MWFFLTNKDQKLVADKLQKLIDKIEEAGFTTDKIEEIVFMSDKMMTLKASITEKPKHLGTSVIVKTKEVL